MSDAASWHCVPSVDGDAWLAPDGHCWRHVRHELRHVCCGISDDRMPATAIHSTWTCLRSCGRSIVRTGTSWVHRERGVEEMVVEVRDDTSSRHDFLDPAGPWTVITKADGSMTIWSVHQFLNLFVPSGRP